MTLDEAEEIASRLLYTVAKGRGVGRQADEMAENALARFRLDCQREEAYQRMCKGAA